MRDEGTGGALLIHTEDNASSAVAFGYGSSANFTETMRIEGNGNAGIGTTTPTAKLEVRGDIKMGALNAAPEKDVLAAGGVENLRIVRGAINSNGGIVSGTGFTIVRTGTGTYQINFNPAFTDTMSITATPAPNAARPCTITWNNATESYVLMETWSAANKADLWFNFIAIGAR